MQTFVFKVQRAQAYFTIVNALSFNYKCEPKHLTLSTDTEVWETSGCNYLDAREKYISFVQTGIVPDFSKEIEFIKSWLSEHGHKTDWLWEGTVKSYRKNLAFLEDGYLEAAKNFIPVRVIYKVETLEPYALGTYDKADPNQKVIPFREEDNFEYIEEGFLSAAQILSIPPKVLKSMIDF